MEGSFLTRNQNKRQTQKSPPDNDMDVDAQQIKQCIKLTQDYLAQMNTVLSRKKPKKSSKRDDKVIVIDDDDDVADGSYGTY